MSATPHDIKSIRRLSARNQNVDEFINAINDSVMKAAENKQIYVSIPQVLIDAKLISEHDMSQFMSSVMHDRNNMRAGYRHSVVYHALARFIKDGYCVYYKICDQRFDDARDLIITWDYDPRYVEETYTHRDHTYRVYRPVF